VVVDGSGVGQNEGRVWVCYVSDSHVSRVAKRREGSLVSSITLELHAGQTVISHITQVTLLDWQDGVRDEGLVC